MNPIEMQAIMQTEFYIENLDGLDRFAAALAGRLGPGDVLALNGGMGAGKTTFIQRLARHLGIDERVTSPTFVLIHEYLSGRTPLIHADLYRLGTEDSGSIAHELLGILQEKQSVMAVEWAEYGPFLDPFVTATLDFRLPDAENAEEEKRMVAVHTHKPEILDGLPRQY